MLDNLKFDNEFNLDEIQNKIVDKINTRSLLSINSFLLLGPKNQDSIIQISKIILLTVNNQKSIIKIDTNILNKIDNKIDKLHQFIRILKIVMKIQSTIIILNIDFLNTSTNSSIEILLKTKIY